MSTIEHRAKKHIFALLAFVVLLMLSPVTSATTLVVALDGSGNYRHISDALSAAQPGDTIYVKNGTYREDRGLSVGSASISIVGENKESVILTSGGNSLTTNGVYVTAQNVKISGVTVTGYQWGVYIAGTSTVYPLSLQITDCILDGNQYGIYSYGGSQPSADKIVILNNTIRNNTYGIYFLDSVSNEIIGNNVSSCSTDGIYVYGRSNNISNNSVVNSYNGITVYGDYNTLIRNDVISGGKLGFMVSGNNNTLDNNTLNGKPYTGSSSLFDPFGLGLFMPSFEASFLIALIILCAAIKSRGSAAAFLAGSSLRRKKTV